MHFQVVSIFDSAAGVYSRPAFVPSTGVAIRDFTDEVNRKADDNQLSKHPEDFSLYLLAAFDDNNGVFSGDDSFPQVLVRGKDVVRA